MSRTLNPNLKFKINKSGKKLKPIKIIIILIINLKYLISIIIVKRKIQLRYKGSS